MSDITIRTADSADAETIVAFNAAMALETENRALDGATLLSGVRRLLSDPTRGVYYLAELNGKVVGQLLITREWSDWRNGAFWWIQSVYVLPEQRGGGVYRALHEHVERLAREQGHVCGLRLYVDGDNTAAQRVYERLGMSATDYRLYEIDWAGPATPHEPRD